MPTCPKCPSTYFRLTEANISGSQFRMMMVECSSCGAAIGVVDYYNVGQLLKEQNKALKTIAQAVGAHVNLTT